jgi:hypothetical protein
MLYTVVLDTGDAGQDDVLAALEQIPEVVVVQFMGPGALVGPYEDDAPAPANPARAMLRHIVTGAIERGETGPIVEQPADPGLAERADALRGFENETRQLLAAAAPGMRALLEHMGRDLASFRSASPGVQFDLGGPSDETVRTYGSE